MSLFVAQITAVILAGGRSSRMAGKNKGLMPFRGKPMISHVIDRLKPQVSTILISANQDQATYRNFGYPVFSDVLPDHPGPLAGIYTALCEMNTDWLVSVPCDIPFIGSDFVARLANVNDDALIRVAHDGKRQQSACCLLHRKLKQPLADYLHAGRYAVYRFLAEQQALEVDFSDQPDTFININTLQALDELG